MFHKGRFIIEDWFGPFEGWTNGQRWNGWSVSFFRVRYSKTDARLLEQ